MSLEVREVKTRKEMRTFIYLPEKIHAQHPTWVHPIYVDEWKYFNPDKNKAFAYCSAVLYLAFRGKEPVGRVMGIVNSRYNEYRQEKTARFGFLEIWEDQEVIHALLSRVEEWARQQGMDKIVGPYGFSDQDPEGFIIEGFEHRATIATYHNFEWMPRLVENEGYSKDIDYYVYQLRVPKELPEFYIKIYNRVMKRGNFSIVEFKTRKEMKPWIKPMLHLMNKTYSEGGIYGFSPLDEKEMEALARRYLPLLDPRFSKVVQKDSEGIAFIVGIPDLTEGIQRARGHLFPFGFLKILRAARKTKQLDLLLGAIDEKYRGMGLDVLMGVKMIEAAQKAGMEVMDTHHEMETNVRVRAEMERMGGRVYKKFRVFKKPL